MHKSFFKNLDLQSNNVEQVYNENLKKWKIYNTNLSDKDFVIQEIEHLLNINLETISELDLEKRRIYSAYLSKIKSQFPWDLEDHYNRYKDIKKFYMVKLNLNQTISYEDFKYTLYEYKIQYYYIWDKLDEDEKVELKCDFIDQLKHIGKKKEATKYKELIKEARKEIKSAYKQYRENIISNREKRIDKKNPSRKLEDKFLGLSSNQKADFLFKYLCEHYRKSKRTSQVKFINILHFLKNDADKNEYIFTLTQDEFNKIIEDEYKIKISKFAKSAKYHDVEIQILNKLEYAFRMSYEAT
ncbi:hypothetical protein SAMN06265349_102896 [Flavobacterium resistens]|uniref:Uncharacterized protein n=1 Tax=Flavobacterium resistens TaxID=443612 RepID=A0A521CT96_9FLAO|nr:hypothetical protein [Flavobacterium resistens]MRX66966.1 hypothetical protein [Flavobacterium resistens]SMO62699.1 hypothetical protein SAMN06265349_102896 [Flavobacterium resistens]